MKTERSKQTLYFPAEMLAEIRAEAMRQDRSISWLLQRVWRIAADEIRRYPSPPGADPEPKPR